MNNKNRTGLYSFFAVIFFIGIASERSFALEVNQTELKTAGNADAVIFKNYTGPHARIDSLSAIKGIGSALGAVFSSAPESAGSTGNQNRYYVIHAVDPSVKEKLDADIFVIGPEATVDHIDNMRRIIASYLTAAYAYSDSDAATIATFVTVYNAVYRGKPDTFRDKYKDAVTKNLIPDKVGIALDYKEWPGRTQLVIPLSDVADGGLSTVDTSVISDKQVVQSMREKEGKGIDDRKNMVDIKEREAGNATQKAQNSQKQAVAEQNKAVQEQQKLEDAKKAAAAAQNEAAVAQKQAEANPGDKQARLLAEQKQKEAEQKQKEEEQQKTAALEQQKKADQAQIAAADQQAKADKKLNEAQTERTEIAKDQQAAVDAGSDNSSAPGVFAARLTDEKKLFSSIVEVSSVTGLVLRQSPVTVIRNRVFYDTGSNFIAVAGENGGNGAVKLVLLDKKNMEIVRESTETVAEDSMFVQSGNEYYCIIKDTDKWVLGKYDQNLTLTLKSAVPVKSSTPVTVDMNGICVTAEDGSVKLLRPSDLTEIK
jgi:hypothetical protein